MAIKRLHLLFIICAGVSPAACLLSDDQVPEPSQDAGAIFRLFRTRNIYTFLKLDTRTGLIWQVQWGSGPSARFERPLSDKKLVDGAKPGRFTLYPTGNIFTFVLLDQQTGAAFTVQWSDKKSERFVYPILPLTAAEIMIEPMDAPAKPQ